MSAAETVYSARVAYPDYLVRGRAQTVTLELYRSGALVAPTESGSTFTLYDPAGNVIVTGAVTVTGSIATYAISAGSLPTTRTLGHGYREEWALVLSGVTRTYRRDAALVLHAAYPVIADVDIAGVYSDISAQRASTVTSFQAYIDEAWKRILGRLEGQGVFPEHVVTSWSLREMHLELTLYLICMDLHRAAGGEWLALANTHKSEFERALTRAKFVRDAGDGNADGTTMQPVAPGVTYTNAAPRNASWRGFGGM